MPDILLAAPEAAATQAGLQATVETIEVRALGSFHENANMTGKLLQPGDTLLADKPRAIELRANGLVVFANETEEIAAAAKDPKPRPIIGTVGAAVALAAANSVPSKAGANLARPAVATVGAAPPKKGAVK